MKTKEKEVYEIIADRLHDEHVIDFLQNKSIMITGATGLIGTSICKALIFCNEKYNSSIQIIALARDKEKLETKYSFDIKHNKLRAIIDDIRKPIIFEKNVDYIIHCASITSSRSFVTNPVETIDVLVNGTQNVLSFAKEKKVSGFLYLSTLEIYGDVFNEKLSVKESDYHYIDFLNVRSSYPEAKRLCECLCSSYFSEYNVPIFIARLSQTIGSDIDIKNDNRVFADFARCVLGGKDIVLKTSGNTIRSYCDITDATVALFYILSRGEKGNAYNVTNTSSLCSIKELAEMYCKISNKDIKVTYLLSVNSNLDGYNHEIKINLDASKIESLGWKPLCGLEESICNLLRGIDYREH